MWTIAAGVTLGLLLLVVVLWLLGAASYLFAWIGALFGRKAKAGVVRERLTEEESQQRANLRVVADRFANIEHQK